MRRTSTRLLLVLFMAMVAFGSTASASDDPNPVKLGAQWWQLVLSIPNSESPFFEDTGVRCITGQRGDVWFLYGNPSTVLGEPAVSYCTVPAGVSLFFPIITIICIPFPGETMAENRTFCREGTDAAESLNLEIDGHDRPDLIKRQRQYRPFPVSMPEENFFDFDLPDFVFDTPAGIYRAVADGYYTKVRLPKGEHTIHFQASVPSEDIAFDQIYVINVVAPERSITPRP